MMMVCGSIEHICAVTLGTRGIAIGAQFQTVRLMTIRARNSLGVHPALHERAELEILRIDLTIGVVRAGFDQLGQVVVQQRWACSRTALSQRLTPCVTGEANCRLCSSGPDVSVR
jgi:hypothetical protein